MDTFSQKFKLEIRVSQKLAKLEWGGPKNDRDESGGENWSKLCSFLEGRLSTLALILEGGM